LVTITQVTIEWLAQHLSRDLVRPSSGLKELAQTMKKKVTMIVS